MTRRFLIAFALLLPATLPAVVAHDLASDWAAFKNDFARTGGSTAAGPAAGVRAWEHDVPRYELIEDSFEYRSPVVASGRVFAGDGHGNVTAWDAKTGQELWRTRLANRITCGVAVVGAQVYACALGGYCCTPADNVAKKIHVLNAATGEQSREYPVANASTGSPIVEAGLVFFVDNGATVEAYDAASGAHRWEKHLGVRFNFALENFAAWDGRLFIVEKRGANGNVSALDAATGKELWRLDPAEGPRCKDCSRALHAPLAINNVVYVGSEDRTLYALDASTGATRWRYTTDGSIFSSPSIWDETLFIASTDKNVYALDARSGTLKWKFATGGTMRGAPAVADGVLYIGAYDKKLYAVDAINGQLKWTYEANDLIKGSPAVAGGYAYFADQVKIVALGTNPGLHAANAPPSMGAMAPAEGATAVSRNPTLSWVSTDPDAGDGFLHDVYFGRSNSPPLAANGHAATTWQPWGPLDADTKYYWKVVTHDHHGAAATGPVQSFTTGSEVVVTSSASAPTGASSPSSSPTGPSLLSSSGTPAPGAWGLLAAVAAAAGLLRRRQRN